MKIMNKTLQNIISVLRLGMTATSAFVMYGVTYHSVLGLPINRPSKSLNRSKLQHLQQYLDRIKLIIIDLMSTMEKKRCIKLASNHDNILANVQNHLASLLLF